MEACLQLIEMRIASARADQFIMASILDKMPLLQGHNPVGAAHGRKPMGDDKDRAALGDATHVLLDDPLTLIIERARRLIKNEDPWIADQSPRNGNALPLAARQAAAPLSNHCVVAMRQIHDKFMRTREPGRRRDTLQR